MTLNVVDEPETARLGPDFVCVFCRRHPIDPAWRPFCSRRCRQQDLARWTDERYRVPAEPVLPPDEPDESSE